MSFNKKKLAACLGLAMAASTIATSVNAIEVAADNVGKLLMGPIYVADAGNSTKITVTNPDNDRAVKARMAFRSGDYSDEYFDFIIYLSPGDVFRGEIYGAADGTVMFKSSDDSVRNLPGTNQVVQFSDTNPTDFAVPITAIRAGDSADRGHFEVLSVYSAEGTISYTGIAGSTDDKNVLGQVVIQRGMSKVELAKVFDDDLPDLTAANNCASGADSTCATLKETVETTARIYGEAEIAVGSSNRVFYPLTALTFSDENNNGIADCNSVIAGGYCEKVMGNPDFDVAVGNPLSIGVKLLPSGGDNIVNIERALAAASFGGAYESDNDTTTSIMVTFPTRYRHENTDVCINPGGTAVTTGFSGPFNSDRSVPYFVHQFDNSENLVGNCVPTSTTETNLISGDQDTTTNTTCPPKHIYPEVEVIPYDWTMQMDGVTAVGAGFESGKYLMDLNATTVAQGNSCAAQYAGVPAIVKTLKQATSTGTIIGILDTH